ncbi:hypothetical protein [Brachybacterium phenoliresistens]|uniref:hypothetical protein n=1 Tax=Brachybacterium phenoliresistens TaxID=396014 RepID=UPI0031DE746F
MSRSAGAPPSGAPVHPLPMPAGLALLRGAFTVSGWTILTLPLLSLAMLTLTAVEALAAVLDRTAFSETERGDALLFSLLGSAALVSAGALVLTCALWVAISAAELRIAESVAGGEMLSAQDARRLGPPSGRVCVLLSIAGIPALLLGGIVALIMVIEDDPEFGGWQAAPWMLLPGVVLLALALTLRLTAVPAEMDRLDALRDRWPPAASRPEPLERIAVLRPEGTPQKADTPRRGRRRAESRRPFRLPARKQILVATFGAALVTAILVDVFPLGETWLAIPLLLFALGGLTATAMLLEAAVRGARAWTALQALGVHAAIPRDYARRHPARALVALTALAAGAVTTAMLVLRGSSELVAPSISSDAPSCSVASVPRCSSRRRSWARTSTGPLVVGAIATSPRTPHTIRGGRSICTTTDSRRSAAG